MMERFLRTTALEAIDMARLINGEEWSQPILFYLVLREVNELLISPHPLKSKPLEEDSWQTY
jgi:hypothetical protein